MLQQNGGSKVFETGTFSFDQRSGRSTEIDLAELKHAIEIKELAILKASLGVAKKPLYNRDPR